MTFLGWQRPLLHSAADWLLNPAHIPAAPDLSRVVVVVRGRRAGRRLLELLALQCANCSAILVPPEIVTPAQLVLRHTRSLPHELAAASTLATALAWAGALEAIGKVERSLLFRQPGNENAAPGLRTRVGLGRHLSRLWSELGGAGLTFSDVIRVLGERFPHVADVEIPRWQALASLHRRAGDILETHGLTDPTNLLIRRAHDAEIIPGSRVVLVGVVDMPRIVRDFLVRLDPPSTALIFAPESERAGFEADGVLHTSHWENRPAALEAGQIHLVERDRDQGWRAARVIRDWHAAGIAPAQMTIAAPDTAALPRLREAVEAGNVQTRSAQGRPASDASSFRFLRLVADYLDHAPDEPPRYEAVAALVRHPDLPGLTQDDWSALDRFASTHLPDRFDPGTISDASERVRMIDEILHRVIDAPQADATPVALAGWTLTFLHRTYAERTENALSPEGRVAVHALELLRDLLAETAQGLLPWPGQVRASDFLHLILGSIGDETVPEPAMPTAVQIVGWLELPEDDAPAVVVTSLFEGAVPESISADPFLPGSMRKILSLNDNDMRLARDIYALTAVMASRANQGGGVVLIAPRFDAAENPVRPSRLLLSGLRGEALARRVWWLAGKRSPEAHPPVSAGNGFTEAPVLARPSLPQVRVTAFRDYLESPRKFYFRHLLDLREEDDSALELQTRDVGTLLHLVLAAFGANRTVRDLMEEEVIRPYVLTEFDRIIRKSFGRWAQPAVEIQADEIRKRLRGFATAQAALRRDGWSIRYVEGAAKLEAALMAAENTGTLQITGRVDRIDCDSTEKKWRIIDYKSFAKRKDPEREHRRKDGLWRDLQLPLYLKLAAPYARAQWGAELTPENCELVYFLLPDDESAAGLSKPFPPYLVEPAWTRAGEVAAGILRGDFADNPPLRPDREDPALLGLCGQVGLRSLASVL